MLLKIVLDLTLLALGVLQTSAIPHSTMATFVSTAHTDLSLRYVQNSGICETTPGVQQVSGYIDVGKNMSMVREYMRRHSRGSWIVHLWWCLVVLVLRSTRVS